MDVSIHGPAFAEEGYGIYKMGLAVAWLAVSTATEHMEAKTAVLHADNEAAWRTIVKRSLPALLGLRLSRDKSVISQTQYVDTRPNLARPLSRMESCAAGESRCGTRRSD